MNKTQITWTTVQRKVNDLIPQDINPRKITKKEIEILKKSIVKFDLAEIPAINLDNKILAGHQRLMILKLLNRGEELIDVRVPNRELDKDEADEYLLLSNKSGGSWDYDLLKHFKMNTLLDCGFQKIELSKAWDMQKAEKLDHFDIDKELKKIKNPKTKLGDIVTLGKHRLICGDSTERETVTKLAGSHKVKMINQDPPFNIGLSYSEGVAGKKNQKDYGGDVNDSLTDLEYKSFIESMLKNALSVATPDCHVFYWCDEKYVWIFQTLYIENNIANKRLCIWVKNNASPTPQIAMNKVTEFCVYGTIGSPYLNKNLNNLTEVMNPELGSGNKLHDDLNNLFLTKRLPGNSYSHPTEKNPDLHHSVIKRCTEIDDIILDLTAGSGSILIAAEQLGRIAYVSEKNPIFCDLIINRYEALTGVKAIYENR
jgi:DNA modification methylase